MAAALYADLYIQLARMGIDVIGESQLVGYPSQYPSVSMMNYIVSKPNARFWALKLLKDHLGPGDRLVETHNSNDDLTVQAFRTTRGRCILAVNKRTTQATLSIPDDFHAARVYFVAPSSGDGGVGTRNIQGGLFQLEPNEVALILE